MTTLQASAPRPRIQQLIVTIQQAWATDYVDSMHRLCLAHLAAKRGATPAQLRNARHEATIRRLIAKQRARISANVCTALPLLGYQLVPAAIVRYE